MMMPQSFYDQFIDIDDISECKGLKVGELFLYNTDDVETHQKRQIVSIKKYKDHKVRSTIIVCYRPETTPVANDSMFGISSVKSIKQKKGYKIITLGK